MPHLIPTNAVRARFVIVLHKASRPTELGFVQGLAEQSTPGRSALFAVRSPVAGLCALRTTGVDVKELRITTAKVAAGRIAIIRTRHCRRRQAQRATVRRWSGEPVKSTLNGKFPVSVGPSAVDTNRNSKDLCSWVYRKGGDNLTQPKSLK